MPGRNRRGEARLAAPRGTEVPRYLSEVPPGLSTGSAYRQRASFASRLEPASVGQPGTSSSGRPRRRVELRMAFKGLDGEPLDR